MSQVAASAVSRGGILFGRVSSTMLRAGQRTFWPLADQGVVSIGNFLTLVLVARALPNKSEYGVFGLLLECIFYLNTIQSALVVYPLTIKGALVDDTQLRRITTAALLMTCAIALPAMLLALGLATTTGKLALGVAGVFAMLTWQVQEVVRRALMAHFRYAEATWGDALRYLGTAGCVAVMWRQGTLTLGSVFFVIGAFCTLAIILQTLQVGPRRIGWDDTRQLMRDFWSSGRWMMFTSLSAVVMSIFGVWTLSFCHGNGVVGDFYAIANFTKPVNPLMLTFTGLVVQHAAKKYDAGGIKAAKRVALRLSVGACLLILPYLAVVIAVPGPAMRLFYGRESHFVNTQTELALRLLAGGFVVLTVMNLTGAFLNGIHRTRENFFAQIVNSIATIAVTFPLTIFYGLIGGLIGGIVTLSVQLAAMCYFVRKAR